MIRHRGCSENEEREVTLDTTGGSPVCKLCLGIGDNKCFLTRICSQLVDMDLARLLHARMYAQEKVQELLDQVRGSVCYQRRCRSLYEKWLDVPLDKLHKHVQCTWRGKAAHEMSPALRYFHMHLVKVCIDVQPWHGVKEATLNQLLKYMAADENVPRCDLQLVRSVCTGEVARHPAIHGMLSACAIKIQQMETGKSTTMRNPRRSSFYPRNQRSQGSNMFYWGVSEFLPTFRTVGFNLLHLHS